MATFLDNSALAGSTTPMNHSPGIGEVRVREITPLTTIELRIRLLEHLVSGSSPLSGNLGAATIPSGRTGPGLVRRVMDVQSELNKAVDGTSSLERFVDGYDQNANLLSPSFSLSRSPNLNLNSPSLSTQSMETKISLVMESEDDFKLVSRGLGEIESLDGKGVVGAGNLSSHYALLPRLNELVPEQTDCAASTGLLENRLIDLLSRYDNYVSNVSDAFLELNRLLGTAEAKIALLERDRSRQEGR